MSHSDVRMVVIGSRSVLVRSIYKRTRGKEEDWNRFKTQDECSEKPGRRSSIRDCGWPWQRKLVWKSERLEYGALTSRRSHRVLRETLIHGLELGEISALLRTGTAVADASNVRGTTQVCRRVCRWVGRYCR